ncbi:MAG TPA: CAP domain-containing protein [Actinoplanes sp.]|nr:CAP domain-containing protein [Actinoplanes sp.]
MLKKTVRRLALAAIVPAVLVGSAVVATPADAAVASAKTLTAQLVAQTNASRVRAGCPRLKVNAALGRAAVRHSYYMAVTGRFSHTGSGRSNFVTRARAAGYRAPMSENIGWGYRTSTAMFRAWMASPGHRRNILNCSAKSVGIGVNYSRNGTPYFTQVFGRV